MDWYRGKKVFITGGSSGIGKAAALQLAAAGASVAIAARGQARLDETLAELRQVAPEGTFAAFSVDIGDREAVRAIVAPVLEALGGLDVLINNAGITHPAHITDVPDDVFDDIMQINYFGMVHVTRAFLSHFIEQGSGHISNVSSLLGFMGIYGYTAYAASKFAMVGFSECLRQDLMPHGIQVSVVYPPDTDTPQFQAENETKPEATRAIAGNVKVMSADAVAGAMLRGIARGKWQIVPGAMSKLTHFAYRHSPWLVRWVIDGELKKHMRRSGSNAPGA